MNQVKREISIEAKASSAGPLQARPIMQGSRSIARKVFGKIWLRSADDIESNTLTIHRPLPKGWGYLLSLILFVAIPSIFSVLYLIFIASDQYAAESRFAVRSAQTTSMTIDSMSPQSSTSSSNSTAAPSSTSSGIGGIPSLAGQDPYIVTSYIHSRAIIDDLSKTLDLRAIFRRPESDFWARLKRDASTEDLVKYWYGMVTTNIDGPSGIVTVTVRTFRPDDSLTLLQAILKASEDLVNDVSARARSDAMTRAEGEVRRYSGQVREALLDLRKFRDAEGFIDPTTAASATSQILLGMLTQKIQLQNDFFVGSRAMSPDAPTVKATKAGIDSLDIQIEQMKSKLTGNSAEARTISASLAKFEELDLKRIFAEQLYTMAQNSLQRARVRAEQQNLYVSVFVSPALPQDAEFPKRFAFSAIIPIGLLILWGIFALIAAAVEDHRV